eukprot:TRINITY_DN8560_c0_g1_i1.p1 TRINITY_DN8560_c0_g1~~TRINITY_DN8560_c0_g1_i1.p1  ORF type:complete len:216 (+),score=20.53 TRINITY_DN8560_c0_g1_i1:447-1094(+)
MEGSVTRIEFNIMAKNLADLSQGMWILREYKGAHTKNVPYLYLVSKDNIRESDIFRAKTDHTGIEYEFDLGLDEGEDPGTISSHSDSSHLIYEYHIIYSPSFSVPVLYFNVTKKDGTLLEWKQILEDLKIAIKDNKFINAAAAGSVSQTDHPLLCVPFFHLHPCETANMMKEAVASAGGNKGNYLVFWLSVVGPFVRLSLPFARWIAEHSAQSGV